MQRAAFQHILAHIHGDGIFRRFKKVEIIGNRAAVPHGLGIVIQIVLRDGSAGIGGLPPLIGIDRSPGCGRHRGGGRLCWLLMRPIIGPQQRNDGIHGCNGIGLHHRITAHISRLHQHRITLPQLQRPVVTVRSGLRVGVAIHTHRVGHIAVFLHRIQPGKAPGNIRGDGIHLPFLQLVQPVDIQTRPFDGRYGSHAGHGAHQGNSRQENGDKLHDNTVLHGSYLPPSIL